MSIVFTIPIKTQSLANMGGGWRSMRYGRKARRLKSGRKMAAIVGADEQKRVASYAAMDAVQPNVKSSLNISSVVFTRIAPRKMDNANLGRALKHVEDGVCTWLGIDDANNEHRQEIGKVYGVRVEIVTT